ncbi:MAG: DMT family transporter [Proteobacteria bacterium]|nr:DMT family transporter [Pseudomonadota bacterium]
MATHAPPGPGTAAHGSAVAAVLVAALLFGLGTPAVKGLLGALDPALAAGLLYLGMGGALGAAFLVRGAPAPHLARGELGWLALAVGLGGAVAPWLLFWGLARSPATVTSLLLNAEVVLTALIARFWFGERYGRRLFAGLALITGGSALLGGGGLAPAALAPTLAVLGACLAWAIDNNATRRIAHADARFVGLTKGLVAGGCNTLLALAGGAALPGARTVLAALAIGAISYGLSFGLYMRGLRELGAARTGALFAVAPFAGSALAIAALAEPLTGRLAAAAAAMALGVWLHVAERPSRAAL